MLSMEEVYTYRVKATHNYGDSGWSEELQYYCYPVVIDIDSNMYKVIRIGNQVWMAENLKVSKYRNGDEITNATDDETWKDFTSEVTGAYCYYNNAASNADTYGALYNWYAISDSRNLAPKGWHVPTDEEWKELEIFLGMSQSTADQTGSRGMDEGKKLKSSSGWYNDGNGTDEVAFCGLPAGERGDVMGISDFMGFRGCFWSASENNTNSAWKRDFYFHYDDIYRYTSSKRYGFSVRCIQD